MNNKIEILITTNEYILKLKENIMNVSEILQGPDYREGFKLITSIVEGIDWVVTAIENTKEIQNQEISLDELNKILNQMVEAMVEEDNILVSDLFQYEIIPVLDYIKDEIALRISN